MKKIRWIVLSLLFITMLFVTACSSNEAEKAKEVFMKSSEASKELNSFSMNLDVTQNYSAESSETKVPPEPIKTSIDSDIQLQPLALHQTIDIMGKTVEQYHTKKGLYMSQPGTQGWVKAPKELWEQLAQTSIAQQTPGKQLDILQDYVDEFNMEEKNNTYVLSFSSKGDNVQKLIDKTMAQSMPKGMLPDNLLKELNVEKASYTLTINKDTYYPESIESTMDFSIVVDGKQAFISQKMSGEYSNFNEVGEIVIPQEIIKNAQEMPSLNSTQ
ncbi:DUF6612 family protein [Halobacillus hunanensis]|uniref:DUF6612 family protein n=1 Tax=Halobacillus hunanensis TaxID=578214 RepID=UPI0009A7EE4E|nr:DUF6612 family protein [Halobacillus hunanensis]